MDIRNMTDHERIEHDRQDIEIERRHLREIVDAAEGYAAYLRREARGAEKARRGTTAEKLYAEAGAITAATSIARARARGRGRFRYRPEPFGNPAENRERMHDGRTSEH
jgi:hypothetical protein